MSAAILSLAGIPVPNITYEKKGYYISYNAVDSRIYGDVTTAIVVGDAEKFYVLLGNHREALTKMSCLEDCLTYFATHPEAHSKYSDKL